MITADTFVREGQRLGYRLYTGVPCSYLTPLMNAVIADPDLDYLGAANEGDAVAVASGAVLGGARAVAMFQNSGLGNAVSPLTSLNAVFGIPVLLVATWRGEPGGPADEPQHGVMGPITPGMFDLLGIPWEFFPTEPAEVRPALERAAAAAGPYGLLMRKGSVAARPGDVPGNPAGGPVETPRPGCPALFAGGRLSLRDALAAVQAAAGPRDALLATTGYTGRALYGLEDRPSQFYMVGSMGCVGALGLGLARVQPGRRVVVLDGDGAALMRLGVLATVAHEAPRNLVHVLLDNGLYDSTGGQSTVSATADLGAVAWACGYPRVVRATTAGEVEAAVADPAPGPVLVHVKTRPGESRDLPRPKVSPREVAARFRAWLGT